MNDIANRSREAPGEPENAAANAFTRIAFADFEVIASARDGGAINAFTFCGRNVLRPQTVGARDPFTAANFVLVPYANRIAHGRFVFQNRTVALPSNYSGQPHPLHGEGWLSAWELSGLSRSRLTMTFRNVARHWPWRYEARQTLSLDGAGLELELEVRNLSEEPMPLSAGFHPYFLRTPLTRLSAEVAGVWLADESGLPVEHVRGDRFLDLKGDAALASSPFVDHCHTGWRGAVLLHQPDLQQRIAIRASENVKFLHLYVPTDADFFCVEPVSAAPDAFNPRRSNEDMGLTVLAPDSSETFAMRIDVEAIR